MKRFIIAILVLASACLSLMAQPIQRNKMTTNAIVQAGTGISITSSGGVTTIANTSLGTAGFYPVLLITNVEFYGAVHNGVEFSNNASIGSGSFTLNWSGGGFVPGDVGKVASVYGAGPGGLDFTSTIATYNSASQVLLAGSASTTVNNVSGVYGTDDTAAVQAGINDLCTAPGFPVMTAGGTLFFPAGIYVINGALQNTGAWLSHNNAQLITPNMVNIGLIGATLTLEGPQGQYGTFQYNSTFPGSQGAMLWSTLVNSSGNGGNIFDCHNYVNPSTIGGAASDMPMNSLRVDARHIAWRTTHNPNMRALNVNGAEACEIVDVYIDSGYYAYYVPSAPTYTNSAALMLPPQANSGHVLVDEVFMDGFYAGLEYFELTDARRVQVFDCVQGARSFDSKGHQNTFQKIDFVNCNHGFVCNTNAIATDYSGTVEAHVVVENGNLGTNIWQYPMQDVVYDASGICAGTIYLEDPGTDHGQLTALATLKAAQTSWRIVTIPPSPSLGTNNFSAVPTEWSYTLFNAGLTAPWFEIPANVTNGIYYNGAPYLYSPSSQSQFAGQDTGNLSLTGGSDAGFGFGALYRITSGSQNSAFGTQSQQSNTTGSYNTSIGYQSLNGNSSGNYNTALGATALDFTTTGSENTALGTSSLVSNVTGSYNTAGGYQSLYQNLSSFNTALGATALYSNISGEYNTAVGSGSLVNGTAGIDNTAIGYDSVYSNTGSFNIGVGYLAGFTSVAGSNNIWIGNGGSNADNGKIYIGTSAQSNVNIPALAGYTLLGVDAYGNLNHASAGSGTVTSVAAAVDAAGVIASWAGSPITTSGTLTPTFATSIQTLSGTAAANSVWGNNTGSTAGAAFTTSPHFGGTAWMNSAIITNSLTGGPNFTVTASNLTCTGASFFDSTAWIDSVNVTNTSWFQGTVNLGATITTNASSWQALASLNAVNVTNTSYFQGTVNVNSLAATNNITIGGNAVVTNSLTIISSYSPGSNYLINFANYTNTANLIFRFVAVTNNLKVSFTNVPDGCSFLVQAKNGSALTNGIFFNQTLSSTNLYPCRTNNASGFTVTTAIPTTSTNSELDTVFVASGTNVLMESQTPFNF